MASGASLRVEIFPADLDATVAFYVDVLGFRLDRDEQPEGYVAMSRGAALVGAAVRPAAGAPQQRHPPIGVELVLEVDDLDADHHRVVAAGWPFAEPVTVRPWGRRDFRLLDPEGYYWRVTSRFG